MEQGKTKKAIPARHHFDFALFAVVLAICAFGLVMLFSASYYEGQVNHGSGIYFLKKQLIFFGAGLALMLTLSYVKFDVWKRLSVPGYIIVALILGATLLFGVRINEATRWINIAGFQFQPSELAKFALVVALASAICSKRLVMQSFIQGVLPCLAILIPFSVLIILQPNFSLVLILCLITYVMLYLGGTRRSHRFLILVVGLAAGLAVLFLKGYRSIRIISWLNPGADPKGAGYQMLQSRTALGDGGFFGQGLSFSRQKFGFLPEQGNDYIFAIIAEELGFVGCFLLMLAYFFAIYRGTVIAMRCHDKFGRLLAGGITAVIAIQVILNISVVTGATPSTGQTLPFVSYGGTSLMTFMAAVGILLNISRYTEVETENAKGAKRPENE